MKKGSPPFIVAPVEQGRTPRAGYAEVGATPDVDSETRGAVEMDMTTIGARYKTGQKCEATATYDFDGYTDPAPGPRPTAEEQQIRLNVAETFPPIRSTNRGAWWKLRRLG